jgi:type I restriction enzyme, S subunit
MGDILFVKDGVNTGIAAVNSIESQFSMLSSVALLRPRADSLNGKFLMHWLNSPAGRGQMLRNMSGAAIKRLVLGQIREAEIPLPPLDEQRRIAAILDQADELRRKRREALERLQAFKTISFETMFLGLHAADTPLGTIQDLTATTQYGTSSKAGETGEFPILRMGNITYEGELDRRDMKFIDLAPREVAKYTVVPGDILFNRTNSPDLVGKTAVFRGEERLAFAGYLVRLRTNDRADPEYVSAYLNSKRGKAILRGMCKTIIGMSNINAQELRSIPIPLPPLPLQGAFAARVAEIDRLKSHHRAHLEKLDALFASLQHRAFRGELSGAKEPCETETA